MPVAVKNIPGFDLQSSYFDRVAEIDYMGIRMRYRDMPREYLEAERFDGWQIPHCAIGYIGDTTESQADSGMYFPEQCAESRPAVEILQDHHSRSRDSRKIAPPFYVVEIAFTRHRRHIRFDTSGHGVTNDRGTVRESTKRAATNEAFVPGPHLKCFNRVGKQAGVKRAECI